MGNPIIKEVKNRNKTKRIKLYSNKILLLNKHLNNSSHEFLKLDEENTKLMKAIKKVKSEKTKNKISNKLNQITIKQRKILEDRDKIINDIENTNRKIKNL